MLIPIMDGIEEGPVSEHLGVVTAQAVWSSRSMGLPPTP